MTYLKVCNVVNDFDHRCGKTIQLTEFYLRDPYTDSHSEFVHVCRFCYDALIKEMNFDITEQDRKLKNMVYEMNNARRIAKEYDMPIRNDAEEYKISKLRDLIKYLSKNKCRNWQCANDTSKMPQGERIYTATSFRQNGKRHYTFNFCSYKCFKSMRGKLGIFEMKQAKQEVLV